MTAPKGGWTVFCVEEASDVIESMSPSTKSFVIELFCEFAMKGGLAIDSGERPPGDPVDEVGVHYNVVVEGAPMFFEYLVLSDIREFRVTNLVWLE